RRNKAPKKEDRNEDGEMLAHEVGVMVLATNIVNWLIGPLANWLTGPLANWLTGPWANWLIG
ncbi:MAG: hypothetical protein ACKOX0_01955, partial [Bacteroidota bacterium]